MTAEIDEDGQKYVTTLGKSDEEVLEEFIPRDDIPAEEAIPYNGETYNENNNDVYEVTLQ